MEQDDSKECQRHPALGDLSAAAGHTPLTPLNSQSRSATVILSLAFNSLINLDLNARGADRLFIITY